jgi:hypothetical protein
MIHSRNMRHKIRALTFVFLFMAAQIAFAKDKEKYVDYQVYATPEAIRAATQRYFTQMGYLFDLEHTAQCDDHPVAGTMVFRHTAEGQAGISGLSRCVFVTVRSSDDVSTIHVEFYDHLRGGLSLPATKHYDADRIHKEWDAAFAEIKRLSETPAQQ